MRSVGFVFSRNAGRPGLVMLQNLTTDGFLVKNYLNDLPVNSFPIKRFKRRLDTDDENDKNDNANLYALRIFMDDTLPFTYAL